MSVSQTFRYPRSSNSSQFANSSQKAKRPSPGKRKTSSSLSYTNSETPLLTKNFSVWNNTSAKRSNPALERPVVRRTPGDGRFSSTTTCWVARRIAASLDVPPVLHHHAYSSGPHRLGGWASLCLPVFPNQRASSANISFGSGQLSSPTPSDLMDEKVGDSEGLRICQVAILQEASGRTEPFLDQVCQPLRARVFGSSRPCCWCLPTASALGRRTAARGLRPPGRLCSSEEGQCHRRRRRGPRSSSRSRLGMLPGAARDGPMGRLHGGEREERTCRWLLRSQGASN